MIDKIIIKGAREHNLKNVSLELPRDKFIVMTGLSGSGKSSLAFDTIYADGQRRYIESLSSYARMFLGQMEKPDVDSIEGLSPAISIDQKTTSKNPRSTVGTVTEIYDYLRLLYARIGIPHCPECGIEIKKQTVDQIADKVTALPAGTKIQVLAPVVRRRKGEFKKEIDAIRKQGFVRIRLDGSIYDLSETIKMDKNKKHEIEIVVDRLVIKEDIKSRLTESIETAGTHAEGLVYISVSANEENGQDEHELHFSQNYACPEHGAVIDELSPRMFSFNNPYGACPTCTGLGVYMKVDPDLIIPNYELSIEQGAIHASGWTYKDNSIAGMYFDAILKKHKLKPTTPLKKFPKEAIDEILYGTDDELIMQREEWGGVNTYKRDFEGIIPNLERRYRETSSQWSKGDIELYMSEIVCPDCKGERLNKSALSVTVSDINISSFCKMSVNMALDFIECAEISERDMMVAKLITKELKERLGFLKSVGLGYLSLSRAAGTLSGGESQRIRLATQIGSCLTGVLYVLDEPSIGLHQRDNDKLITTLKRLRDLGNTLIVVEHDEDTMLSADYIVDIGPYAGVHGGEIIFAGLTRDIMKCKKSVTGQYLSGKKSIPVPKTRRQGDGRFLEVTGAAENNLKNINVKIPLGIFTCVTGVSGSGKSSLVNEIIFKHLAAKLNRARTHPGEFKEMKGVSHLDKVIDIDQSPIGRTPRSNPATYTGMFTDIRDLFASTTDAKIKGFLANRFSFNVKGGRCEACEGDGIIKIEMHFLPDVYVPCEVCKGKRYSRETLEIRYKGKNIYDVLEMTVDEGLEFFGNIPKVARRLQTLQDVGLGYIKIGQPATTLSGGEAQRVKLATELSKRSTGKTIYILDEPTTGLHTADVHKLIEVLQKLTETGNSVLVIEHNLDIIKTADYIIDLGPEGGDEGGYVIATGTPEVIAACEKSYTGKYLRKAIAVKS
jgi:excinuclease ABC subunit A